MSVRLAAFEILRSRSATPLREVAAVASDAGFDARDRALLRRLIATEVRRRTTLRALARSFAHGAPDRDLLLHLHLGLAQIFFLDQIPGHAAVAETVSAVAETLGDKQARYANAMLREAIRSRCAGHCGDPRRDLVLRELHLSQPVFRDADQHPLLWAEDALSIPVLLFKRWSRRHGSEQAHKLALDALAEPDVSLRTSAGAAERGSIIETLVGQGVNARAATHPRIVLVRSGDVEAVIHSELFQSGAITVQGESALRAAELVDAQPGETILDLCASPGGKTAVLAESAARVVACDVDPDRIERVRSTLERLSLGTNVELLVDDAASTATPGSFDAVLADVPCSNTGVLAARPCARWRFDARHLQGLALAQQRLLERAAAFVRPGGRLVYSTCSIEPEENQRRVAAFLAEHGDFELDQEIEALPSAAGASGPVDGGYAARLQRRARRA